MYIENESTLYIKKKENDILIICIDVDDIYIIWVYLNIKLMSLNYQ